MFYDVTLQTKYKTQQSQMADFSPMHKLQWVVAGLHCSTKYSWN